MDDQSEVDPELGAFYDDLAAVDLQPLWTQTRSLMPAVPAPAAMPWLWEGETLRALATRARDLITIERGGERRVLALANPGLGGDPFATPTLWGAIQALGPHESAPAHRHTAAAIRFVAMEDRHGVAELVPLRWCRPFLSEGVTPLLPPRRAGEGVDVLHDPPPLVIGLFHQKAVVLNRWRRGGF